MAITNPNSRVTTTGTCGVRGELKSQPCFRASFRPQVFILAEDEYAFLHWGSTLADSIPRQFMITAYTDLDDDTNTVAVRETGILTILEDSVAYVPLHPDTDSGDGSAGTDSIVTISNDVTTLADEIEFGYDADGDLDGNPCYYVGSGFTDRTVITITRIDAQMEDLEALIAG